MDDSYPTDGVAFVQENVSLFLVEVTDGRSTHIVLTWNSKGNNQIFVLGIRFAFQQYTHPSLVIGGERRISNGRQLHTNRY